MTHPETARRFWLQRSRALAWRINVAAFLQRAAPAVFFTSTPFAVAWYALRRVETPLGLAAVAFGTAVLITVAAAWWRARAGFFSAVDARVLLESHLRLDTRLTAAAAGITGWPAVPEQVPAVTRWRLGAPLAWFVGALALVLAAAFTPVPRESAANRISGSPPSLLQTEAMLAALKELDVADPKALEQLAERAQELARRPADEQYSHSALEAADALRNQTGAAAAELARALDSASEAVKASNEVDMNDSAGRLSAALSGLRDAGLPANKNLMSKLPNNGADLKNLSAQQRAQLAQQLSKAAKGVAGAAGANARMAAADPNGKTGPGPGAGGPGGGGSSAPLALSSQASDAGEGKAEALSPGAMKNMALGDKLGTTAGAHDVDPAHLLGPASAGAIASPGRGGEAAWVNRLTPAERATLKQFFK